MSAYRFTLDADYTISVPEFAGRPVFVNRWILIEGGRLTVRNAYSWDGVTFVCGIRLDMGREEAPGRPQLWEATLTHDPLYQFEASICEAWGIEWRDLRALADLAFYRLAILHHFRSARLYYWAVRRFGGVYHWGHNIFA